MNSQTNKGTTRKEKLMEPKTIKTCELINQIEKIKKKSKMKNTKQSQKHEDVQISDKGKETTEEKLQTRNRCQ